MRDVEQQATARYRAAEVRVQEAQEQARQRNQEAERRYVLSITSV